MSGNETALETVMITDVTFSLISSLTEQARESHRAVIIDARTSALLESQWEFFEERLAELELALEDREYRRLSAETEYEFSREGLREITRQARLYYLKNPLINRGVSIQALYVWAQGVTITAEDPGVQKIIDDFMQSPGNAKEMFSHQARTLKEVDLQVDGNLFFVFFADEADTGELQVRTFPFHEIADIIRNPDDRRDVWFYKRFYNRETLDINTGQVVKKGTTVYYPDWQHAQESPHTPTTIGTSEVMWASPVHHIRVGGTSDMKFGVSECYQAIDWARAYKSFLEDWATIVKSYQRFAWNMTVKGGAAGIAANKLKLQTKLLGDSAQTSPDSNPPPVTGSVFIGGDGNKMEPFKVSGAMVSAEDSRRLFLMVCAAFGLPETFFGSTSDSNLATSKSLDRPTELKFRDRQQLWHDELEFILNVAVNIKLGAANSGIAKVESQKLKITFPPILERDLDLEMKAVVSGATLDGKPPAGTIPRDTLALMIMSRLGVEDPQEELDKLQAVWDAEDEQKVLDQQMAAQLARKKLEQPAQNHNQNQPQPPQDQAAQKEFANFALALKSFCEQWASGLPELPALPEPSEPPAPPGLPSQPESDAGAAPVSGEST